MTPGRLSDLYDSRRSECRDDSLLLAQPKQIDVTKIRQADLFDTANMRFPVLRTQRPEGQRCTGAIE